jgi:hypothetical protein
MSPEITPETPLEKSIPETPTAEMPAQDPGVNVTTSIPFADLEIFVIGTENDKAKIDILKKDLVNQINMCKEGYGARIMYYMDNGEKTFEEKKAWMLENMKCRFYVFANTETVFKVEPDFVKKSMSAIIRYHKAWIHLHNKGIVKVPFKKQQPAVSSIPEDVSFEDMKTISDNNLE